MAIQTLNTIKKWFKTGLKPTQNQFWDTWDSFRHKFEQIPLKDIEELETTLLTKAEKSQLEEHQNNPNAHAELFSAKENKSEKGTAGGYVPLNEFSKITHQYLDVVNNLTTGGETALLSAEQGFILQNQIDIINTLLSSDNIDLDTIQKIADVVEQIQISLSTILVNDLTTGGVTKALTAEMGKLLETSKEDKSQKGIANGYAPLNDLAKIASQYLTIINDLTTGGTASILSAEQGVILQNQINTIFTLLSSDNVDLDTLQEIVDAIEKVQISLDTILVNDLTTGGTTKALTAEMGKQLNEIKLTGTIATDAETQITDAVTEDKKVISRSKLFNWWENIKRKTQTISATWNFSKGLKVNDTVSGNTTEMLQNMFVAQLDRQDNGINKTEYGGETVKWTTRDGWSTLLKPITPNQNRTLTLPNKSGTIAISNDYVKTASGTATIPPLIIPKGFLNTLPQDGAIERDTSDNLYHIVASQRERLLDTRDLGNFLSNTYKSTFFQTTSFGWGMPYNFTLASTLALPANTLAHERYATYIFKTFDKYTINYNGNGYADLIPPTSVTFEVSLKGINCKFSGQESIRLYSVKRTDLMTVTSLRNNEIALVVTRENRNTSYSCLCYSELIYDNIGNVIGSNYKEYNLQTPSFDGQDGNMFFSDAQISIEYRMTVEFADSTNKNTKNANFRGQFINYSTFFLKT